MKALYFCEANGVFGRFGDYVWATSKDEAVQKFQSKHHVRPTRTVIERHP